MTNALLQIKIKQRVNKLDSEDYDNLFCWQIQEAFNKVQRDWARRQINGINQKKEGRETSSQSYADLQVLLTKWQGKFVDKGLYYESCDFPEDYLVFSRVSASAVKKGSCCNPRRLIIYQAEESNIDIYLNDQNKRPSWEWKETFSTFFGNKVRIYTNKGQKDSFDKIKDAEVTYYRSPKPVQFLDCINTEDGTTSTVDIECEFQDNIIEILIDETAAVLSADIADLQNSQRELINSQHNT